MISVIAMELPDDRPSTFQDRFSGTAMFDMAGILSGPSSVDDQGVKAGETL